MTKSQLSPPPPQYGTIFLNQWKGNQHLTKMNFGAIFSKFNIPPPPWFSPKNASIPIGNGKTMQFQVFKHLLLSSAPWKTTK